MEDDSTSTLRLISAKKPSKNAKYSRNDRPSSKGWGLVKGYMVFAKLSVWVINLNCQKHAKNDYKTTLELFCAKSRSKKHQVFKT